MSDDEQNRPSERDDAPLAAIGKALAQGVVITGERVQEAVEDAVRRGRMTRRDAQELVQAIVSAGRRQTDELRGELEKAVDRGRERLGVARENGAGDEPFSGYDDLTAAEIVKRVRDLDRAGAERVAAYEQRHANRKTVLRAAGRETA